MRRAFAAATTAIALLVAGTAGCSRDHGSEKAFCKEIKRVPALDTVVEGFADADPQELTARLKAARAAYARLHDAAPKEIRSQVGEVQGLADVVTQAVEDHHDDPEAVADQVRTAMGRHKGAAAAAAEVTTYAKKTCGIDLNPVVSGGG